jgi:hypothetical protein
MVVSVLLFYAKITIFEIESTNQFALSDVVVINNLDDIINNKTFINYILRP